MITYDWRVEQMTNYPHFEGHENVVFNICWRVNAVDGNFSATAYGSVGVPYTEGEPFTPYDQLTPDQVVVWVKAALGDDQVAQIESGLAGEIDNKKNPKQVINPLPWEA